MKMNQKDKEYFLHVIDLAMSSNISVSLHNTKYVYQDGDSIPVLGSFGEDEFTCCFGLPYKFWFPTFVHESCHMDQFLENTSLWNGCMKGNIDYYGQFFKWIQGDIDLSKPEVKKRARICLQLELDCEKRAVEKIKEWNLSLDIDEYIRHANSYVLMYNFARKHRIWTKPGQSPYKKKEILAGMSCKFDYNYNQLPKKYEELVIEYCFNGDLDYEKQKSKNTEKNRIQTVDKRWIGTYYTI